MYIVTMCLLLIIAVILFFSTPIVMGNLFLFFAAMSAVFLMYSTILTPIKTDKFPDRVESCKQKFNVIGTVFAFVAIAIQCISDDKAGNMVLSGIILSTLICVIFIKAYLKRS